MSNHSHYNKAHQVQGATSAPMVSGKPCADQTDVACGQPGADGIRVRAYEISKGRNGGSGDAMSDWVQAEREVAAGRDAKS